MNVRLRNEFERWMADYAARVFGNGVELKKVLGLDVDGDYTIWWVRIARDAYNAGRTATQRDTHECER